MKGLALIVRSDHRGLGQQTYSLFKTLEPERVLILDDSRAMPDVERYFDRYPHSAIIAPDPIQPRKLQDLIDGMDILLSCETFYFDDTPIMAESLGVKTALQFNYEFCRWANNPTLPRPNRFIAPSSWNLHKLPLDTHMLPPPILRENFPFRHRTEAKKFVHVVGRPAFSDRAGTRIVMEALQYVKSDVEVILRSQVEMHHVSEKIGNVKVTCIYGDELSANNLYEDADVLLAPRRYGGLSLPLAEASSCGLPIIALNRKPESDILSTECLLPCRRSGSFLSHGLEVGIYSASPQSLARRIDYLATHDDLVSSLSLQSNTYADTVSSRTLGPRWVKLLEETIHESSLLR